MVTDWDREKHRQPESGRAEVEGPNAEEQLSDLRFRVARHKRMIQRKATRDRGTAAAIPQSTGSPLSADVRSRMEPQLGADLSKVRVHTGGDSAEAAEKLGARAFTTGSDIHFGSGEFSPGTKGGDQLLAHELAHTIQAPSVGVQRKTDGADDAEHEADEVSHPNDPAEKEADAVGEHAAEQLHGHGGAGKHGGAAEAKAPVAKEAAPAVGRKIFLERKKDASEPKKDVAGAAVKRIGKSGGDTQQVKDTLKQVQPFVIG